MIGRLIFASLVVLAGCKKDAPAPSGPEPKPAAPADPDPPAEGDDEQVPADLTAALGAGLKPVYDPATPPHPLAERLCRALHELPVERRRECCQGKSGRLTLKGPCVVAVSGALAAGAVALDAAAIQACEAAMARTHEGCEWVGPAPPLLPRECRGILRGTREAGAACRSVLECSGGLICLGAGAMDEGRCEPPRPEGAPCGAGTDVLAAYTLQPDESLPPQCGAGFCSRHRCRARAPAGGACEGHPGCAPGLLCVDGRCAEAELPGEGRPCLGGRCAAGLRCVDGACATPRPTGAPCTAHLQCRGACQKAAGAGEGRCGMQCGPLIPIP